MQTNIELEQMECPSCHLLYWISKAHRERLVKSKESFYCPNGHSASFMGKTDEQKYQEEKEKAERYYGYLEERGKENEKLRKEISSYKGQLTRLKNAKKSTQAPSKKKESLNRN